METNSSTSFLSRQRLSSHEIFDPTTVIPFILTKLLGENADWIYSTSYFFKRNKISKVISTISKKLKISKDNLLYFSDFYNSSEIYKVPIFKDGNATEKIDFVLIFSDEKSVIGRVAQDNETWVSVIGNMDRVKEITDIISDIKGIDIEPPVRNSDDIDIIEFYYDKGDKDIGSYRSTKSLSDFRHIHPSLYPDIDLDILVDDYVNSDENILVLMGEPGTGKTTFLKFLMKKICEKELSSNIVYVKDEILLKEEKFWMKLNNYESKFVILDDLDYALQPRTKANYSSRKMFWYS